VLLLAERRALRTTKLTLMTALADLRVRTTRFLVLYRWHLSQHSQARHFSFVAGQSAAQQKVAAAFQVVRRHFIDRKFPPEPPAPAPADLSVRAPPASPACTLRGR
jgi:hypothetical protein